MTEIRQATETCIMGSRTEHPCLYPATEPMQRSSSGAPKLCAFHASTEPLYRESDALALALELVEGWEAVARAHDRARQWADPRAAGARCVGVLSTQRARG